MNVHFMYPIFLRDRSRVNTPYFGSSPKSTIKISLVDGCAYYIVAR